MYIYLFFLFSKLLAFSCEHLRTESGCIKTIYFSEITTVGDFLFNFVNAKKEFDCYGNILPLLLPLQIALFTSMF